MIKVFSRSCTSFETMATARKTTIKFVDTGKQAREICHEFNDNRTQAQINKGTKYEFMEVGR